MSSIIQQRNKKNGDIYVYSSESYWDKEKKRPGAARHILENLTRKPENSSRLSAACLAKVRVNSCLLQLQPLPRLSPHRMAEKNLRTRCLRCSPQPTSK